MIFVNFTISLISLRNHDVSKMRNIGLKEIFFYNPSKTLSKYNKITNFHKIAAAVLKILTGVKRTLKTLHYIEMEPVLQFVI